MPYDGFIRGYCIECWLNNQWVDLMLNSDDFFECSKCRLQLKRYADGFVIMRFRGQGRIKEGAARLALRDCMTMEDKPLYPLYGVRGSLISSEFFALVDEGELRAYLQSVKD